MPYFGPPQEYTSLRVWVVARKWVMVGIKGMRTRSKVAIVLENAGEEDREALKAILNNTAWTLIDGDPWQTENSLRETSAPIVLYNLGPSDCWRERIRRLKRIRRDVCVILIAAESGVPSNDDVARYGGFDILTRPLRRDQVLPMLLFAHSYCRGHGPYLFRPRRVPLASAAS